MDAAVAGAADLGRYGRRIVKMIWDPEPVNDTAADIPVWCLGCSYTVGTSRDADRQHSGAPTTPPPLPAASATASHPGTNAAPVTPPDSASSSFSSSLAYEDAGDDSGGWPVAFLDDFESRIWMTYRSSFDSIPRSADPKASTALSFSMRLRTLGDQSGFTSDSGWGCMIRSGQCLLANALAMLELGRGAS